MRTLTLRRGLNILWARSKPDDQEGPRIGGHGAGKTTFCRLLRFLLDEKQPGTSEFRQDFRSRYDDGWVLGEVIVQGKCWLVGKTLGDRAGRHHFAVEGGALDQPFEDKPPKGGYAEYQAALEAAALGRMQLRELSGSAKKLEWRHLLPWLSRDQEAHYASLLTWRDTDSESDAPELSAADRENLVRLVLGLVEREEQRLLRERAQAASQHEEKLKQKVLLEFVREREKDALGSSIGRPLKEILGSDEHLPHDSFLIEAVERAATSMENDATKAIAEAGLDEEVKAAEAKLVERLAFQQLQAALLSNLEHSLEVLETELEPKRTPPKPRPTQTDVQNSLARTLQNWVAPVGICNQLKSKAKQAGCPLYRETKADPDLSTAITKQEQRDDLREAELRKEIAAIKVRIAAQQKEKSQADVVLSEASSFLDNARKFVDAETKRLSEPASRAIKLRDSLKSYQTACQECESLTSTLINLESRKKDLDADIEKLSSAHQRVVSEFSELFGHIAKGLVGNQVEGRIRLAGKGILPELHYHGRRRSAALDLAKLLAFDLSCLALGMISENTHHPRFILHDSPRESDLSVTIYNGLFRMARFLETACEGEAAFQYIVTTTEAPPEELRTAPWLLEPVLDSNDGSTRFLGEDLAL